MPNQSLHPRSLEVITVGVDHGGTWTRLAWANAQDKILRRKKFPSTTLEKLPQQLKKILSPRADRVLHLRVAARGTWKPAPRKKLEAALKKFAQKVEVIPDVVATHRAAFKNTAGLTIIAGTGSIIYGENDKRRARAGGHAPRTGDPASGKWLAQRWQEATGNSHVDAKKALSAAAQGNVKAQHILEAGIQTLAQQAAHVAQQLKLSSPLKILLWGGLFQNPHYKKTFQSLLQKTMQQTPRYLFQPQPIEEHLAKILRS